YPYEAVNGLLIKKNDPYKDSYDIIDVIPLFHQNLTLTAMLEIALTQIDVYCEQNDMVICGYYQANSSLNNNDPDLFALKIMDKILANFENPCLIIVNNTNLSLKTSSPYIDIYRFQDGKLKNISKENLNMFDQNSNTYLIRLLGINTQNTLIDFDNHLDNINNDWKNHDINNIILKSFS
ncbi:unnamed protein product, partial [Gordionus sp. m RMFG-2023]